MAHYDNTFIYAGGNIVNTIHAGDFFLIDNSYYGGSLHRNMYVRTSEPAYMYQALAGGTHSATIGMNFIPPFSCLLNDTVGPMPSIEKIGTISYNGSAGFGEDNMDASVLFILHFLLITSFRHCLFF